MTTIDDLIRRPYLDDETIESFIEENDFPLVHGRKVTFVFRGGFDQVYLRHFIYGLESRVPFHRIAGSELWYCTMELPKRSRVEYKIEVVSGDNHTWIRDPLNHRFARDPFGANSVCPGAGYVRPEWTHPDDETREGRIEQLTFSDTPWGDNRRVDLYLPARFRRSRRYPLLVVHDGGDYQRYADLKVVLDNLIHRGEVAPLVAALSYPHNRMSEYPDDDNHAAFISQHVVPWLEEHYPLYGTPEQRCLMGASFGAVASLHTAWKNPEMFGRLLLQSGSFAFTDIGNHQRGPAFDPVVDFINAFRENPGRVAKKAFISCGQYESLIYENRSMVPFFRETGMEVRYVEARDGHNWENWRDRLREGLSWLFPGHMWMVYE
jgi:enterochelin esterase-like enzyme